MNTLPALVEGTKTTLPTLFESALADASRYALASKAESSKRAYASDWAQFTTWCAARGVHPMPATVETTVSYLADMAKCGLKLMTIRRRAAAIRYFHKLRNEPSPTDHEMAKAVMAGIARETGAASTKKAPATVDVIKRLVRDMPATLTGRRNRALLLVGFAGAMRRSELVGLNVEDLELTERGLLIHIRRSKTDQEGVGRQVAIPTGGKLAVIEALYEWIEAAGIETGAIFRSVTHYGVLGDRLTGRSVADIIKAHAERADLDPSVFSGHSLRAGFVTTAFDKGADAFRIMDVTGHTEVRTLKGYDRRAKFDKHAGRAFL